MQAISRTIRCAGLSTGLVIAACGPPPAANSLLSSTAVAAASASETHVTYARSNPAAGRLGTLVVAYNQFLGASPMGWSWSTDGGLTWTVCNALNPMCGGGVPFASGTSRTQVVWNGDPAVAAAANGSFVFAANMGSSSLRPSGPPDMIVGAVSLNGGQSFTRSVVVNDRNCIGSFEDHQNVSVDATLPNRVWVTWRHLGTDLGAFGLCIRGGNVNSTTGTVSWLRQSSPVPVETEFNWGIGSHISQGGDGALTIVYSNTDKVGQCDGTLGVAWLSVTSFDGGVTWPQTRLISSSNLQRTCLPTQAAARVQPGARNFGFVRDSLGHYWVAVPADNLSGIRLYSSNDTGDTWKLVTTVASPAAGDLHFFPTLAADPERRVGLSFQTINSANSVRTWFSGHKNYSGSIGGRPATDWSPPAALSPAAYSSPGARALGDYNGMVGVPAGDVPGMTANFVGAWSQGSGSGTSVNVAGVQVTP